MTPQDFRTLISLARSGDADALLLLRSICSSVVAVAPDRVIVGLGEFLERVVEEESREKVLRN